MADKLLHKHRITENGNIEFDGKLLGGHDVLYKLDRYEELELQQQVNGVKQPESDCNMPLVSQRSKLACSDEYHQYCYKTALNYNFCPECGISLKQACG